MVVVLRWWLCYHMYGGGYVMAVVVLGWGLCYGGGCVTLVIVLA